MPFSSWHTLRTTAVTGYTRCFTTKQKAAAEKETLNTADVNQLCSEDMSWALPFAKHLELETAKEKARN